MPSFGTSSLAKLETCDYRLIALFQEVVKDEDCQVIQGARTKAEELDDIARGVSRLTDPMDSKHVVDPLTRPLALAVDVAPYPVDWTKSGRFCYFAGYVMKTARIIRIVRLRTVSLNVRASPCRLARSVDGTICAAVFAM